jgi:anthranilate synthase component 1
MIDRERFLSLADADEPVVVRVASTLDVAATPLGAYTALADDTDHGFLLESAGKTAASDPDGAFRPSSADPSRHARYSFVGYDPDAVVTVEPDGATVDALGDGRHADLVAAGLDDLSADPDALDRLRAALPDAARRNFAGNGRQYLDGGLVGFLAYDAVYDCWLDEVGVERPETRFPDARFVLNTKTVAFDEVTDSVELVQTPIVHPDDDPDAIYDALDRETERVTAALRAADVPAPGGFDRTDEWAGSQADYEDAVRRTKEAVLDGEIYQGVISRERRLTGDIDPLGLYAALRDVNPSPYMYLLAQDDHTVVGASPETLVSVQGSTVTVNPIAGTCQRGPSPVEDRRLAGEMLADGKERAEHTMLVDLARNDVRRVGQPGSVRVEEFMGVLKYSHVQHIESTVTAELAADADAFDATRATFPAGTLAGAPKIRAMEIIDRLETTPRGVYGGGVGYYSWDGDADFAIVIRTATIEHGVSGDAARTDGADGDHDRVTVRAGAGIVADSVPTAEYEETEQKMDGVLAALDRIASDHAATDGGEP